HQAHHRVEVGPVQIDLPAVRVDDPADVLDGHLEDAVRGGIGDHQRREVVRVRLGLLLQVGDVHVALRVAADHHDLEAGEDRGGGVGPVRAGRDEAHVAV